MRKTDSKKKSKKHYPHYDSCSNLPLSIFCEITQRGNIELLSKDGQLHEETPDIWENIIQEYSELTGSQSVNNLTAKYNSLVRLQNSYVTIKAMLRYLMYVSPSHPKHGKKAKEFVDNLNKMKYTIDTTSTIKYAESLMKANRKAGTIMNYIRLKQSEIKREKEKGEGNGQGLDFDEIMAMLSMEFDIKENISVKRYIKCMKILDKKYAKQVKK